MARHEAGLSSVPPSRPLSRASRAESIGSLAECHYLPGSGPEGGAAGRVLLPEQLYEVGRRQVGGGGLLLQGRSPLSSCPPLLSRPAPAPSHDTWPYKDKSQDTQNCSYVFLQLNSRSVEYNLRRHSEVFSGQRLVEVQITLP